MTEATWYSQGAFCWSECATSDVEGAKAFYGQVFGLDTKETPIPEEAGGGTYVQFQKRGKNVAGLTPLQDPERERGIPPHWNTYIAVEDADLVTKEAEALGGTIVAPAFDVLDSGRMAVVIDPTGATVAVYRKIHLYDSFGFVESERLSAGPLTPAVVDVGSFRLGLLTCYDVRFPEHARLLVDHGADVFAVPAAWVAGPLKEDHWTTLLRARAIENTAYVLGAAQCGPRYSARSAVIDPMGIIVAGAGEIEADVTAEITTERVAEARRRNPSLANRRLGRTPERPQ
ncbi:MAG: nitrilase-related carbon-nitrogen hydrolase [Nocardioidaceae bacterium]